MPPKVQVTVSPGNLHGVCRVLAAAFASDAINRLFVSVEDGLALGAVISNNRREKVFLDSWGKRAHSGVEFVEAGDFAAVAIWTPPRSSPVDDKEEGEPVLPADDLTVSALGRKWDETFGPVKARLLKARPYYYLNLIGRDPTRKESGVIRALIEPYITRAKAEHVPAYVEANDTHARDVYQHLGFQVCEEVVVFAGICDANGERMAGGSGVTVTAMIFEP